MQRKRFFGESILAGRGKKTIIADCKMNCAGTKMMHKKKEAGNYQKLPAKSMKKKKTFICNYSLVCTGNNIPGKCEQYVIQI